MPTLESARRQFLEHLRIAVLQKRLKPATRTFYEYQLRHLDKVLVGEPELPILGKEMAQITATDLFHCPQSNHFIRAARRLWRFARVPWLDEVTLPPCGQRERVLSRLEFRKLRKSASRQVGWILWLIYYTGMRPEEVRELTWENVRETEGYILLKRFKARDRRRDGLRTRYVPLPAVVRRALRLARVLWQPRPDSYVFFNRYGHQWTGQALRLAVVKARRKAGFAGDELPVAYTQRHTAATRLAGQIQDITMLADILGHTSLTTTRRYVHRTAGDLVAAVDRAFSRSR